MSSGGFGGFSGCTGGFSAPQSSTTGYGCLDTKTGTAVAGISYNLGSGTSAYVEKGIGSTEFGFLFKS